jgi:uncharacterized protein (UPF0548 family)
MGMPGRSHLTYDRPGATRDDTLPAGYDHLDLDEPVGHGEEAFERAVEGLMTWRMHQRAGLRLVSVTAGRAAPDVVVVVRAGPMRIPCRVVYTVDEPDRRGFGYGSLPGHPIRGEEAFTVRLAADGEVRARIRAFSRPAALLPRLGGPLMPVVQRLAARRYLGALRKLASGRERG